MDEFIKGVGVLIGLILYTVVKKWWTDRQLTIKKAKSDNSFSIDAVEEINREVTHEEKKILWRYSAMRMYVIHFTNGTVTEAGISLKKIIFMHEVVQDYYVEPIAKYFAVEQPLPQKFIAPYLHVDRTDRYFLPDVDEARARTESRLAELQDKKDTNANLIVELEQKIDYYNWLIGYKVKSTLWIGLKNKSGKLMAILVIHWPAARAIDKTMIPQVMDMARSVEDVYNKFSVK